jgi:hypothetical protein
MRAKQTKMSNVKFTIDLDLDLDILMFFSNQDEEMRAGWNIYEMLIREYPELKKCPKLPKEDREKVVREFLEKEYKKDKETMLQKKEEIETVFNKIKEEYFITTSRLFDNHDWPEGNYIANFTVWGTYPRIIQKKTFYIPFKRDNNNTMRIVCHEMLHMLFFDYWGKNFRDKLSKELSWDFSEIINVILLNLPEVNKFFKVEEKPFPNHIERYNYLKEIYPKCNSMKEFCEKSIIYLKEIGDKHQPLDWDDLAK